MVMRRLSLFNVTDLLLLPFVVFLFIFMGKKAFFKCLCLFIVCFFPMAFRVIFCKSRVYNDSNEVIHYKPEIGDELGEIPPHESRTDIDGVSFRGQVYKIPDGVIVSFDDKGIHHYSLIGYLIYRTLGRSFGGWKTLFCEVEK